MSIQNARAIEAALQQLQGPAATGKLLVKATGPDRQLPRGTCLAPVDGGALERRGSVFVRTNPATATAKEDQGAWTVTAAGVLVDVEALQGGEHGNRDGGLTYIFDPPVEGIELEAVADAAGLTGGSWLETHGALKQFSHIKTLDRQPGQSLFASNTWDFPAAVLAWGGTQPLDGSTTSKPGPQTGRMGAGRKLYRHTWLLYLVNDRLDGERDRTIEGDVLRADVMEVLTDTMRIRGRALIVSAEPGATIVNASPFASLPTCYVDLVTVETIFTLEHRPGAPVHNPWLRTRMKNLTGPGEPPANDPPLELPNIIVPMPPDGPGPGPYP